jgi:hypothetical protein
LQAGGYVEEDLELLCVDHFHRAMLAAALIPLPAWHGMAWHGMPSSL